MACSHVVFLRLRAFIARISSDQSGTASVEAALWMPIFAGLMLLITNVSMLFSAENQALRIIQDGNRAFSTGRLTSDLETEEFIYNNLSYLSANAVVETTLNAGIIYTKVTIPVGDLASIGSLSMFSDYDVSMASQIFLEY